MKSSNSRIIRNLLLAVLVLIVFAAPLAGLIAGTLRIEVFESYLFELFVVNLTAIAVLVLIIGVYIVRLVRQWQKREPGSRLTVKFLGTYTLLTLGSLCLVYYFAFHSLSKGVDNWFDTQTNQALTTALSLGSVSINALRDEVALKLKDTVAELETIRDQEAIIDVLNETLQAGNFSEITYFEDIGTAAGIVVSSGIQSQSDRLVPSRASEQSINAVLGGNVVADVELDATDSTIRVLVPVPVRGGSNRILQVLTPLPRNYEELVKTVESARNSYNNLVVVRGALKFNFILTLTFVTLVALLVSLWMAIEFTRHLLKPIQNLSEGTLAVAKGDYDKLLPVTTRDDIGVLVESFNDMTSEIKNSHDRVRESRRIAEEQRTYLESVLKHLSSGVFSIDQNFQFIDMNLAAQQILELKPEEIQTKTLIEISQQRESLEPLRQFVEKGVRAEQVDWQDEIRLETPRGTRTLICSVTKLPLASAAASRYSILLEDVTELVKAQRGAAWGEVAQRFAHEIRNPLTPIQFAVDRIKSKTVGGQMNSADRDAVNRAINAIYRQLHSMQNIVIEFRDYAQVTAMNPTKVELNQLVRETVELHSAGEQNDGIIFLQGSNVHFVHADPDRLRQVLNNLIINSKTATENVESSEIKISTQYCSPNFVELSVVDNGYGFNASKIDKVFEPYETSKGKGAGLGLAIVKRIVEEHGGQVSAANTKAGGGKVTIRLPIEESEILAASNPSKILPSNSI